jgi:signal transduction histidine kinase/CheY-like chemotaxis protein
MGLTALFLGIFTWTRITSSIRAVERSWQTRMLWERVLALMTDAETGQRGFLITGAENYLAPFERAKRDVLMAFEQLKVLHFGTEEEFAELPRIQAIAEERLRLLQTVIDAQREDGIQAAKWMLLTGRGKSVMDALRANIAMVEARLDKAVADRTERMRTDLRWGYLSAVAAGVVALGAGAVALRLFLESQEQLRREAVLTAGKLRAEQADREKSTFLATMSHEIRTPMNAVLGFGELLEGEDLPERARRHVQSILAGGRSLLQIINDILDLSKIEAGMMEVRAEPTDLHEVAAFVRQLFAEQAALKGVQLRVEIAPELPKGLVLDGVRLRQILLNLVGNALKFTDRGFIVLRVGGERGFAESGRWKLVIEVEDSGIGIPAPQLPDVFKPFVQGRDSPEAPARGTGLGLAIVRRLVDLMKGTIAVTSEVGRGTKFTLEFPQAEVAARLAGPLGAEDRRVDFNDLQPASILAADDNETNRTLMLGLFENTHHRLTLVTGGREAVEAVARERPDVVLMDVRMPGMNGQQALEAIRSRPGGEVPPVIAVTASSLSSEEDGLRMKFDGYVRKPFSRQALFEELSQFIPRVSGRGPVAPGAGEVRLAVSDEEARARWRTLVSELRQLERVEWPAVRDAMVMSRIAEFAEKLRAKGSAAGCEPVVAYASRLSADAEAFAVSALETSLADFSRLIADIESATSAPYEQPVTPS